MKRDPESIGAAIGRIPSGCAILTTAHGGPSTGVLVSWVQQAAFDPPSITVALKQGRPAGPMIDGSKRFTLNVIGDDPAAMFKHFGKGFASDENAFEGLEVEASEFGPLLPECVAQLGCEVTHKVSVGDHDVYVATVVAGRGHTAAKPYVHTRKSGLSY